ncbi:MAG TPA: LysR substrate-binding domain-containing protein [Polyangiaceae bacterium]|nr:LysR substrate-binding domain-containing protein [Polyangiaceae bacterium]
MAFVAVVDAHGFTAAARATHGRKATLSRRVAALEARLGVSLLARSTRSLRLTEEGQAYFEHARRSLASACDAEAVVLSAKSKPTGLLRVTTSASLAVPVLEHVIAAYLTKHPDVAVQLDTSDRRIDLVREGFDLAIRIGPLDDSSLIARRLGFASGGFYASPRYLAKKGSPNRPEDVASHDTIVIPKAGAGMEWPFVVGGKRRLLPVRPRLIVTDLELAARAGAAGLGILRAPLQIAQPYLARNELVAILREWTLPSLDVYAVFPSGGGLVPKTRVFVDMLEAWFKATEHDGRGTRRAGS